MQLLQALAILHFLSVLLELSEATTTQTGGSPLFNSTGEQYDVVEHLKHLISGQLELCALHEDDDDLLQLPLAGFF